MSGLTALILLGGGVLLVRLLFVGCRMSSAPWWARDAWLANLFLPGSIALLAIGFAGIVTALAAMAGTAPIDWRRSAIAAVVLALTAIGWRLLGRLSGRAPVVVSPPSDRTGGFDGVAGGLSGDRPGTAA